MRVAQPVGGLVEQREHRRKRYHFHLRGRVKKNTGHDGRTVAANAQAERERKAREQHEAWVTKANAIAAASGVAPIVPSVDFRIAYAKTLRNGRESEP